MLFIGNEDADFLELQMLVLLVLRMLVSWYFECWVMEIRMLIYWN